MIAPDLFDLSDGQWTERMRKAASPMELGTIGPYVLLEEVGRGAQGVVFRARQLNTGRIVALKSLHRGSFATDEMRGRFEREMRAELALDHPNIVRVYDVQAVDGQPLLVMQWIDGVSVEEYVRQSPIVPGRLSPREDTRALLEMFTKIADALQHAHQRGVIHRDLKPSNILVDASGEPHVLDFGLAKLTETDDSETTGLTHTRAFLGTPAYAAPEQVRSEHADVDVRSDVYGLGVILYQILTGRLPFETDGNLVALFDAILHTDPIRPSRVPRPGGPSPLRSPAVVPLWLSASARSSSIDDELETIVLKCLAKDPARRYQSAGELSSDIRRYLASEVIEAKRDSAWYVLRKILRRHAIRAATAGAFLLLLLGSTIVSTVLWRRAASSAAEQAQARKLAEAATDDAILGRDCLELVLAALEPTGKRVTPNLSECDNLKRAVAAIEARLENRPRVEHEIRSVLGRAFVARDCWAEANQQFSRAVDAAQQAFGPGDERVADALCGYAHYLFDRGRRPPKSGGAFHEAETRFREALDIQRRLTHRDRAHEATTLSGLTGCLFMLGNNEAAEQCMTEAQEAYGEDLIAAARQRKWLAEILSDDLGLFDRAQQLQKDALDVIRRSGREDLVADHLHSYAVLLRTHLSRFEDAEAFFRESFAIRDRIYPEGTPERFWVYVTQQSLGHTLTLQCRFREAEQLLLNAQEQYNPPRHVRLIAIEREILARLVSLYERWDAAEPGNHHAEKAAAWRTKLNEYPESP